MEKEHQKTTLMSWKKEQLVEHIQCLEHNNNALEERFEIQYKNFWLLVNDIRHKVCEEIRENAQYKNWSKAVPFVYVITPEQLSKIEKEI